VSDLLPNHFEHATLLAPAFGGLREETRAYKTRSIARALADPFNREPQASTLDKHARLRLAAKRGVNMIRNRIKTHRRVRAGDLVPHELNFRLHPQAQRAALERLYQEIGFARSLLAYELPDGRLKLIDGHLRRDIDPAMEVDVEVLDVNDEEARALLLSMDPLAALAETDQGIHDRLAAITRSGSEAVLALWQLTAKNREATDKRLNVDSPAAMQEKFLVLVDCEDEDQQRALLARFQQEGLTCRALIS
jgi:hypothetical protein